MLDDEGNVTGKSEVLPDHGASESLTESDEAQRDTSMEEFCGLTEQYDGGDDLPEEADVRLAGINPAAGASMYRIFI